ncbi:MAG: DUF3108 domain-containing protein [Desulfuromusa sp.]|nr:DUF3108 domain-containing protein [Desulfuromusa sp.]
MFNKNSSFFIILFAIFVILFAGGVVFAGSVVHPVENLVGERMDYDISFLWFDRLAEGSIRLERGEQPGTYLATMEAKTLGFAAFVTRHRVEKYQTLMEIDADGFLRPLVHSSHTFKGTGESRKEKNTTYDFDFLNRQVHYKKLKSQRVVADEQFLLETGESVFDILSAFYNIRLGAFGPFNKDSIHIPTLHRKGVEEIVVVPINELTGKNEKFFSKKITVCKVLVDPSIFKTNGRELFVGFDEKNRLARGIIKNVIGLGDVKGVLR